MSKHFVDPDLIELDPALGPGLGDLKQALGQLPHLLDVFPDGEEYLFVFFGGPFLLQHDFDLAGDGSERGGQFMRGIGDETALDGKGFLQPGEQFVEGIGQLAHFVLARAGLDAMGEVEGGYLVDFPDDEGDGPEQLPGEQEADQGGEEDAGHKADQQDAFEGLQSFQAIVIMAGDDHDESSFLG